MLVIRNVANAAISIQRLCAKINAAIEATFPIRNIIVVFLFPILARIGESRESVMSVTSELVAYISPIYFSEISVLRNVEFTYAVNAR